MQPKPVDTLGTLLSELIAFSKCYEAHFTALRTVQQSAVNKMADDGWWSNVC